MRLSEAKRFERLFAVSTSEIINKIYGLVTSDRRLKVRESTDYFTSTVECENAVIKMGVVIARSLPKTRWCRFVIMEETWLHYYKPDTKEY